MRNFEEDWKIVNQVSDDLYVYTETYESGHGDYTRYLVDVNNCDKYEPSVEDVQFLNQAKKMILYYMNRVHELEGAEKKKQEQGPPMAQVEQWMNEDYKKFTEEFNMTHIEAFNKVNKKYAEEYKQYGTIKMITLEENKNICFYFVE